jgi:acyl-CoA hydrolase
VTLAQVMLPGDANPTGNVHGGSLMKLADTAGGVASMRHAGRRVVTVVMDSMTFELPAYVGDLVTVRARVTWVGHTSLESEVSLDAEDVRRGVRRRLSTAFFVYVALDDDGHPSSVPPLALSGAESVAAWAQAERRRELRLARR